MSTRIDHRIDASPPHAFELQRGNNREEAGCESTMGALMFTNTNLALKRFFGSTITDANQEESKVKESER